MKGNDKQGKISHKLTHSEYGGRNYSNEAEGKNCSNGNLCVLFSTIVLLEQIKERWQKKYGLMFWLVKVANISY